MQMLHAQNTFIIGTATSLEEAVFLEEQGCDAIAAQGAEAGGHRGSFLNGEFPLIPLNELLPSLTAKLKIPVLAAGGIYNSEGVRNAKSQGAAGAQVGTAFLVCKESTATSSYKEKLLTSRPQTLTLTKTFSGRWAQRN